VDVEFRQYFDSDLLICIILFRLCSSPVQHIMPGSVSRKRLYAYSSLHAAHSLNGPIRLADIVKVNKSSTNQQSTSLCEDLDTKHLPTSGFNSSLCSSNSVEN